MVRGNVRLNQIATIDQYAPLTRLVVSEATDPGQTAQNYAGFELGALPAKALKIKGAGKEVLQFVSWDERQGGTKKPHDPQPVPPYSGSVPFSVSYDGSTVSAQFGEQRQTFSLASPHPVVRIVCSTGEFLYTGLVIEPLP